MSCPTTIFLTWISCSLRILGLGWSALRELATGSCWVSRTASRKAFEQLLFSGLAIDHQVLRYFLFMFVLLGHRFGRLIQCHGEGSRIKVETEGRKRVSQHSTNPKWRRLDKKSWEKGGRWASQHGTWQEIIKNSFRYLWMFGSKIKVEKKRNKKRKST